MITFARQRRFSGEYQPVIFNCARTDLPRSTVPLLKGIVELKDVDVEVTIAEAEILADSVDVEETDV